VYRSGDIWSAESIHQLLGFIWHVKKSNVYQIGPTAPPKYWSSWGVDFMKKSKTSVQPRGATHTKKTICTYIMEMVWRVPFSSTICFRLSFLYSWRSQTCGAISNLPHLIILWTEYLWAVEALTDMWLKISYQQNNTYFNNNIRELRGGTLWTKQPLVSSVESYNNKPCVPIGTQAMRVSLIERNICSV
jgi:hypothetical protein